MTDEHYHVFPHCDDASAVVDAVWDLTQRVVDLAKPYGAQGDDIRIMISGPSGSGKSTLGELFSACTTLIADDTDGFSYECDGNWLVSESLISKCQRYNVLYGCSDNELSLWNAFDPHVLISVIPEYGVWKSAMAAKAAGLGPSHSFYEGMVRKSGFDEAQFNAYMEAKMLQKAFIGNFAHLVLRLGVLPFTSSGGWADSRVIYSYLALAMRLKPLKNIIPSRYLDL